MKRFFTRILMYAGIPVVILAFVYIVTDPFKMLYPFRLDYCDTPNRDYFSTELFCRNDTIFHYNSFIFGSSKCIGVNSYHWCHYLPEGSRQFVFQAWRETLTGIEQKIDFLDKNGNNIDNVLILFDVPLYSFAKEQLSKEVMFIKHYRLSGQSKFAFHACLFFGFIQKPSMWISSVKNWVRPKKTDFPSDGCSNDFQKRNREADITCQPPKDSLCGMSPAARETYLQTIAGKTDADLKECRSLINETMLQQLWSIKKTFDKHNTDYRIVITPAYCYTNNRINQDDFLKLQMVFGIDKVYDYSGKNDLTIDCYNFVDPGHFGLSVGWQIIEDIYNTKESVMNN